MPPMLRATVVTLAWTTVLQETTATHRIEKSAGSQSRPQHLSLTTELSARLNPAVSTRPCTVLQIEQSSVPQATTWFRIRGSDDGSMPTPMTGIDTPAGLWFKRTSPKPEGLSPQGIQEFPFMGTDVFNAGNVAEIVPCNLSAPSTSKSFVAEAWSDRNDLGDGHTAKLLASSAAMTFSFDDQGFSKGLKFEGFAVKGSISVPGMMTVTAQPNNATTMAMAKLISWFGFDPVSQTDSEDVESLPKFVLNTAFLGDAYTTREFPTPTVNVSFSSPGVWYVGIYGAWNGEYGFSNPKPENGVRTYWSFPLDNVTGTVFQPLAIVVPFENGTVPDIARNFAGPVHVAPSIPGDWRLALRVNKISVFHGGVAEIRCTHGPAYPNGGAFAPEVVEIEVPEGLEIVSPPPCNTARCSSVGYENVSDVSDEPGGGKVPNGYRRLRLEKTKNAEWSYLNNAVEIKTAVIDTRLEGKSFPQSRIRAYSGSANQARKDNWQPLTITVKKLTPVAVLPKRLHTSYCWSGSNIFVDNSTLGLNSVSTWKALGFNTVPSDGASYATPPDNPGSLLSLPNRSGTEWVGMKYGIMTSPFGSSGFSAPPYGIGSFSALKLKNVSASQSDGSDGFNFSAAGLNRAQEQVERQKWKAALEFYNETGIMDLAYDGFFKQNDFSTIAKLVKYAKPDYFSMDIESFPEFEAWAQVGYRSSNFASSKEQGETDSAASLRIAQSWLGGAVKAAVAAKSDVKSYLYDIWARYDHGFQITNWPMAVDIGLADMPSYYGLENGLDVLARTIRYEREAIGTKSELIPWFTPGQTGGTGGPQSSDPGIAMYNMLIQGFANGMTGFNVYTSLGMYDMDLWLAMRDAIDVVTAYEDILCDGRPASNSTFSEVAAAAVLSGMVADDHSAVLIASSVIPHGQPSSWTVTMPDADGSWLLCDVRTLRSAPVSSAGAAKWVNASESGTVLVMSKVTPCHSATSAVKTDDETSIPPHPGCKYVTPGPKTGDATNMVLTYMDVRSLTPGNPEMVWNQSMFQTLLGDTAEDKFETLFDGFLMIGISWFDNKQFYPGGANFTVQQDWMDFLQLQLTMGVQQLEKASASVSPKQSPALIITIPYPDTRATDWGTVDGKTLDLSKLADQIAAVSWFVDYTIKKIASLDLQQVEFKGFYWFNEDIPRPTYPLVQAVSKYIHSLPQPTPIFMWIPYYEAAGWSDWQMLGFDVATMQPNWAFHNHTLSEKALFEHVANDTSCAGMGVEMELPLAVRNPQIPNLSWRSSFDSYSAASHQYGWEKTLRTYYYGNSFVEMAKTAPDYFEKLKAVVRATNVKTDDEGPSGQLSTRDASTCCPGQAKRVDASCWLDSETPHQDAAVQAAVDCGAPEVRVPVRSGGLPWVFNQSVVLRDDVKVKLDNGVHVQALRGSMHPSGSHLFSMTNVSGVTLSGYGAVLQMYKEDYNDPAKYKHSEWRHGIDISSSHNILVEGVTVTQTGGDGINIGGDQGLMDNCEREIRAGSAYSRYCDSTNVHIRDVKLLNNSRNAMSITGVVNLTVERSVLAETGLGSGTCCRGGVDMEPETPYRHISNVTMREVVFADNGMTQVVLNLGAQGNNTDNILLDSCVIANSSTRSDAGAGLWVIGVSKDAPMGVITIRNTTIENIRDFGVRIENKASDGALIQFDGGLIQNVARSGHFPILVQSGGVHFNGTIVRDKHKRNWLEPGWRSTKPVVDVEGTVTVYTPTGACTEGWNATRGDEHDDLIVTCKRS